RTSCSTLLSIFSLCCSPPHRSLLSFPTRRSSDLLAGRDGVHPRARPDPLARPERRCAGHSRHAFRRDGDDRRADRHHVEMHAGKDRKSTRLNSSHVEISYAVFCLKKKKKNNPDLG